MRVWRIATHNIMDGLALPSLLRDYRALQRAEPLHALCIQEDVPRAASRIATALGQRFTVAKHAGDPRLALVYDRARLHLRKLWLCSLPRLAAVPFWQRIYTSGTPEAKHALIGHFSTIGHPGQRLTIANFHLDAAGDVAHRTLQLRGLASKLSPLERPLVACGDTNAFSFRRDMAEVALRAMLAPLRQRHGAMDTHAGNPRDTHYFARAHEPKLGQQIAVAFGKLGIDFPRRYDVVCSSLRCQHAGHMSTPGSDHDLVWARLAAPATRRRPSRKVASRQILAASARLARRRRGGRLSTHHS